MFSPGKQEVVLEEESMTWSQSTEKMDVVKEGKQKKSSKGRLAVDSQE